MLSIYMLMSAISALFIRMKVGQMCAIASPNFYFFDVVIKGNFLFVCLFFSSELRYVCVVFYKWLFYSC